MKCLNKKDLILYVYGQGNSAGIQEHVKNCDSCRSKLEEIKSFSQDLKLEEVKLTNFDYQQMIAKVRGSVDKQSSWSIIGEKLSDFYEKLWLGLFYEPKIVGVVATLLIVLAILPTLNRGYINNDFAILQMQAELSVDNFDFSVFDVYEEEVIEDGSYPGHSTLRSSPWLIRRKT